MMKIAQMMKITQMMKRYMVDKRLHTQVVTWMIKDNMDDER